MLKRAPAGSTATGARRSLCSLYSPDVPRGVGDVGVVGWQSPGLDLERLFEQCDGYVVLPQAEHRNCHGVHRRRNVRVVGRQHPPPERQRILLQRERLGVPSEVAVHVCQVVLLE